MQGEQKERWQELCELAAKGTRPRKLLRLATEINRLLAEKQQSKGDHPAPGQALAR
jgi:hypothetical protein